MDSKLSATAFQPRRICVNITYTCSQQCRYCDRLLDAFQMRGTDMSVEQATAFSSHVLEMTDSLQQFKIAGGEPTEHMQFIEIVEAMAPVARIAKRAWVSTSVAGPLPNLPKGLHYRRDPAELGKLHHLPFMLSPDDLGLSSPHPCKLPKFCGVCYDYQGWSFCPVGSQVARVLRVPGVQSATPVPPNNVREVCRHCIYSLPQEPREVLQRAAQTSQLKLPSQTYSDAIHRHRASQRA